MEPYRPHESTGENIHDFRVRFGRGRENGGSLFINRYRSYYYARRTKLRDNYGNTENIVINTASGNGTKAVSDQLPTRCSVSDRPPQEPVLCFIETGRFREGRTGSFAPPLIRVDCREVVMFSPTGSSGDALINWILNGKFAGPPLRGLWDYAYNNAYNFISNEKPAKSISLDIFVGYR